MYKKPFRVRPSIEECLIILVAVIAVVGLTVLFSAAKVEKEASKATQEASGTIEAR